MPRRELFARLGGAARVVALSAPAGSGKTFLLRSWIEAAGLHDSAARVSVSYAERDPQRLWISVVDALRDTTPGSSFVRALTAAPDLDGGAIVERLLEDLASLESPLWLVIDDLHELRSTDALRQLELLLMRAPDALRLVLSGRHNLRLGLHRLRLEADLTEIRAADLRFSIDEARALFGAAGVELSDSALELLVERTEGWAAGLRLAALSLIDHPDPERLAAQFSGSERTVAQYLLAEVLDRQSDEVRQLLLRTSVLDRVSGPLADLLTGGAGGECILQELEEANAFVVALDSGRSWFRYHHLFADLLQLELRRSAPDEVAALHATAAGWLAQSGYAVEAIRHAQAAGNSKLAARLLSDHWFSLYLDGQAATAHELLGHFPGGAVTANPELAALKAADSLNRGMLPEAEGYLALATRRSRSVAADRRLRFHVTLGLLRLQLAHHRGDLTLLAEEATGLLAATGAPETLRLELGEDLRALALIHLGIAELWTVGIEDAGRHLEQGIATARRIERPYLELTGVVHGAFLTVYRSYTLAAQRARQATELAERHGWGNEAVTGVAYMILGGALVAQGRLDEGELWLRRAERALRVEVEPTATVTLHYFRGALELAGGRYQKALGAFRTVDRLACLLVTPPPIVMREYPLHTLVKIGDIEGAEKLLASIPEEERSDGHVALGLAGLQLAKDEPHAAVLTLAPVVDGSVAVTGAIYRIEALLLKAIALEALGDAAAAARSLEEALDLAEPDSILVPFLYHPAPGLLERHRGYRTAHAALVTEILDMLAETRAAHRPDQENLREPLTESEIRVLRYLPTNLSQSEIAGELSLSVHTVSTHIRHLYMKLGAHRRGDAVERARSFGLLAPSSRVR